MAAPPGYPPNMGGDRVLIQDPERADLSTALGDMAALNLRLLHILETADLIPAAQQPLLAGVAEGARAALATANASRVRETNTRVLRPLTRVPAAPYGAVGNVANIRMNNVPSFNGTSSDPSEVTRWLSKVLTVAEANTLSFAGTIRLLIQASSGSACDYIEQMRDEDKTLLQIVQQLEMRYGDLCSREEARVKCNTMPRREGESLSDFIDKLRNMARIACRYEDDDVQRRLGIEALVESNIRRVLPTSVRGALEERIINRNRMGLPAFTAREIEKECLDLERKRADRQEAQHRGKSRSLS